MKYQKLITELRGLADGSIQPIYANAGICLNLSEKFSNECHPDFGFDLVESISPKWGKFSGCPKTPVPGVYFMDQWEGEQGQLRRELCAFIADYLQANPDFEV